MTSRFAATRVPPSYSYQHGGDKERTLWLLTEWPEDEKLPTKFWLTHLLKGTRLINLLRLAKVRPWIEQGYQQLKDELGLDRRTYRQGWNHHVTLTMLAFGFLTLESLYFKKTP
jgi:SRSO17 transposase